MAEIKDIVKVAVDSYHGNVEAYSVAQAKDVLYQALVDANGGSTKLDYRAIRDGKANALFSIIEEILKVTAVEGLQESDFFMNLVDFRNLALGDKNEFDVEDSNLFIVSEAADGTQGVRRQRLGGVSQTEIPTKMFVVRMYEELNRVLAGRVDFNYFINKVSESFKNKLLEEVYALWIAATAQNFGGTTYFPTAGTYSEDALLDLVAHVEAAAGGKPTTIVGTKKALRNIKLSVTSNDANNELYHTGYFGNFYGTPVVCTPQRHKIGSTEFVMNDKILTVVAGDQKPIKVVYEGDPIVIPGDPLTNGDLTQEFFYGEKFGTGIVLAGGNSGIGRYEIA